MIRILLVDDDLELLCSMQGNTSAMKALPYRCTMMVKVVGRSAEW